MEKNSAESVIVCPYCGRSFSECCKKPVRETDRLCMVCGHTWKSRGNYIPRRCPSCRSVEWNVHSREELSCDKCGHRWVPRGGCRPTMCPKCKTHYWMDPAKKAVAAREEQLVTALSMYSEGKGCFEISMSTGAPLESLILRIKELHDGPVRMTSSRK